VLFLAIDYVFSDQNKYLLDLAASLGIRIELHSLKRDSDAKEDLMQIQIPEFPDIDLTNWSDVSELWPTIDYDLFPRWRAADIPVMICLGFLGGLLSYGLHDKFEALHNDWAKLSYAKGGHAAEIIDKIPGKMHRFKYGHDILNPFEVDWDNYFPDGVQAGFMKKLAAWMRHLFQDTFSTEGLPLPGSSYFRDVIGKLTSGISAVPDMDKYQAYKTFFTVKARDITGTMFVASAMTLYIWGTERGNDKKFFNYRYTSLTLGALLVSIVTGLCMPVKNASFNHSAVAAMVPYVVALIKVNKRVNEQLKQRDLSIADNNKVLGAQRQLLDGARTNLTVFNSRLDSVYVDLHSALNDASKLFDETYTRCSDLLISQNVWLNNLAMTLEKEG
jgi:hypothetical protein